MKQITYQEDGERYTYDLDEHQNTKVVLAELGLADPSRGTILRNFRVDTLEGGIPLVEQTKRFIAPFTACPFYAKVVRKTFSAALNKVAPVAKKDGDARVYLQTIHHNDMLMVAISAQGRGLLLAKLTESDMVSPPGVILTVGARELEAAFKAAGGASVALVLRGETLEIFSDADPVPHCIDAETVTTGLFSYPAFEETDSALLISESTRSGLYFTNLPVMTDTSRINLSTLRVAPDGLTGVDFHRAYFYALEEGEFPVPETLHLAKAAVDMLEVLWGHSKLPAYLFTYPAYVVFKGPDFYLKVARVPLDKPYPDIEKLKEEVSNIAFYEVAVDREEFSVALKKHPAGCQTGVIRLAPLADEPAQIGMEIRTVPLDSTKPDVLTYCSVKEGFALPRLRTIHYPPAQLAQVVAGFPQDSVLYLRYGPRGALFVTGDKTESWAALKMTF